MTDMLSVTSENLSVKVTCLSKSFFNYSLTLDYTMISCTMLCGSRSTIYVLNLAITKSFK